MEEADMNWIPKAAIAAGLIALVALVSWLPSWGRPTPKAGTTERVEVWSWGAAALSLQRAVAPMYAKAAPTADLDVQMTGTNLQSRLLLSLSAGVGAPDVSQLQEREAGKFTRTGGLRNLNSVAAKYADDFAPAFWQDCLVDGEPYAIPWDMGPCAVFYKRWVFKKYGVDPEAIKTWDDYIAAGKLMLDKSGGATQMMPMSVADFTDFFQILMQQNGGGLFDAQGRVWVDSPQNREVLALLGRMFDSGIAAPIPLYGASWLATFKGESVASFPGAVWITQPIKDNSDPANKGDWGVFRLPAFRPGGLRTSNMGGSVLVLPNHPAKPDPARDRAAWEFVQYSLCTVPAQVAQYKGFGLFPAYLPALKDPYFQQPDAFFAGQPVGQLFAKDIEKIPPLNRTRDWNEAERMLGQSLSGWIEGRPSASDKAAYDGRFLQNLGEAIGRKLNRKVAPPDEADGMKRGAA